jgi:hypothetical protein
MSWVRKKTPDEKKAGRKRWHKKRLLEAPTRSELSGLVDDYCQRRNLSVKAQQEIKSLLQGNQSVSMDRDYRSVAKADRIPRSLRYLETPPRYWDIFI